MARSWLQKLDVAKSVLVDGSENMRPGLEALAPIFIYLQWISTGSIECVEGGGHYRPNRHAELAKIMFRSLEWVAGDASKSEIERFTARRMQVRARARARGACVHGLRGACGAEGGARVCCRARCHPSARASQRACR